MNQIINLQKQFNFINFIIQQFLFYLMFFILLPLMIIGCILLPLFSLYIYINDIKNNGIINDIYKIGILFGIIDIIGIFIFSVILLWNKLISFISIDDEIISLDSSISSTTSTISLEV